MINSNQKKKGMERKKLYSDIKSRVGVYVIRKYITASSAQEAIKLDKKFPVDDVWLDEEFKKQRIIGFNTNDKR